MLLFVELCVDLRKGKSAKDGLYQYKNIAQNTNVGTIEVWFSLAIFEECILTAESAGAQEIHRASGGKSHRGSAQS